MTDTRKQIIELISDYMDKTLDFGCSIIINKDASTVNELTIRKSNNSINWLVFWVCELSSSFHYSDIEKIIWHYDITAIWWYINSINPNWVWPYYFDSIAISKEHYILTPTWDNDYARIPNKPLHLYTEQEDKDLIDLLLKLK